MAQVDVLIVSYNSRDRLRRCVEPLVGRDDVAVTIADNASTDGSLDAVNDLVITRLSLRENRGFAAGINAAARAGSAPYLLLLNPDARIEVDSLNRLVTVLEHDPLVGAAGPRILDLNGCLEHSIRRFPTLRRTYAQAVFLHRLFPRRDWTDEVVRDPAVYERQCSVDWLSGACLLVRRLLFERLGGLDERFFLYCEDIDLCQRIHAAGHEVRFVPDAICVHEGGASSSAGATLPLLAASRLTYARKHRKGVGATAERVGIATGSLTHLLAAMSRANVRAGHAAAFREAVSSTSPRKHTRSAD